MKYRADIDGLRAVAIIPVLLFHAGFASFSGGYVGVDVFFVISGFLISSIILEDLNNNCFSLIVFYIKRSKRILPALFAVMLFTAVVYSFFAYPSPYFKDIGQSLIATSLYVSNMLFWHEGGYFDTAAEMKPLLHTWSLGIEEQFYIIFPAFLILIHKFFKNRYSVFLIITTLISFSANAVMYSIKPDTAFYLIPFRIWELGVGSLLAVGVYPRLKNSLSANLAGLLGLLLIVAAVIAGDFPQLGGDGRVTAACIGTYLMIVACLSDEESYIKKILTLKPVVFTGTLSYSLYLWHFPVFTLKKYWSWDKSSEWLMTFYSLFSITIVLSVVSYYLIERKFRKMAVKRVRNVFAVVAVVVVIFSGYGFYVHSLNGVMPWNKGFYDQQTNYIEHLRYYAAPLSERAYSGEFIIGDKTKQPTIAIWGDSHAAAASIGIDKYAKEHGKSVFIMTGKGSIPVLGIEAVDKEFDGNIASNNRMFEILKNHKEIKTVVLMSRWLAFYSEKTSKDGHFYLLKSANKISENEKDNRELIKKQLLLTVMKLNKIGKKVYIFLDVPTYENLRNNYQPKPIMTEAEHDRQNADFENMLKDLQSKTACSVVDYGKGLSINGQYVYTLNGHLLYMDDDHLSVYGSVYLAEKNRLMLDRVMGNDKNKKRF